MIYMRFLKLHVHIIYLLVLIKNHYYLLLSKVLHYAFYVFNTVGIVLLSTDVVLCPTQGSNPRTCVLMVNKYMFKLSE